MQSRLSSLPLMSRQLRWTASALLLGGSLVFFNQPAQAQGADIFKGADLALGEKMITEHKCVACHTAGLLRGMVEMCNTTMNLGMFPEEVSAVAAVLNRDHYKFK